MFSIFLVLFAFAGLGAGLVLCWRTCGPPRQAFVVIHPRYRHLFHRLQLHHFRQFLDLPQTIVSGHPDRNVARLQFGHGARVVSAFIKREHRVGWLVRLANLWAGFGPVSRSLSEVRTLQALEREGIPGPEWLAVGEDEQGRAFLLIRAVDDGVDLRSHLQETPDWGEQRRLAHRLGKVLARLHRVGYCHRDLYANHILVRPGGKVVLLDWNRARQWTSLPTSLRVRDLASLDATLAEELASCKVRLFFLRAYLRELNRANVGWQVQRPVGFTFQREGSSGDVPRLASQQDARFTLLAEVKAVRQVTRKLLRRRHVYEKRQPPLREGQSWLKVDGESLCVTPALERVFPGPVPDWLPLARQPIPRLAELRRWLSPPEGGKALLVRRRAVGSGRRTTPEQQQAVLLFRLERHALPAPRVLALGEQSILGHTDSFLLTYLPGDPVALEAWFRFQMRSGNRLRCVRRSVLQETGALLRRLHNACCYLDGHAEVLGVQTTDSEHQVVLDDTEPVLCCRQRQPARARRDIRAVSRMLRGLGCLPGDLRHFRNGYHLRSNRRWQRLPKSPQASLPCGGAEEGQVPREGSSSSEGRLPEPRFLPGESLWQRLWKGVVRVWQRDDWVGLLGKDWTRTILNAPVTEYVQVKQGRSTGRWILADHTTRSPHRLTVYLKRHYRLPWWQGILAGFWSRRSWSPAVREWQNLEWARGQGVPVPEPVAVAEFVGPAGRLQSCLAVQELAGMVPLHQAISQAGLRLPPDTFRSWKRSLVKELARLTRLLHDRRRFHKDLYLCHFYIHEEDVVTLPAKGWRGRVYLIDLHRLACHHWNWPMWMMKDLAQLLYSATLPEITALDQLAFWKAYRDVGPRRFMERWLRWGVLLKCRRYHQHNARREKKKEGNRAGRVSDGLGYTGSVPDDSGSDGSDRRCLQPSARGSG